jgi:hypothetical protein
MMTAGVRQPIERAAAEICVISKFPTFAALRSAAPPIGRAVTSPAPTKNCDPTDLLFAWQLAISGLAIRRAPCYI